MAIIEENSKKLATALCVASCFPVVATVYAMETNVGWHGDKYVNEDAKVAKGWQEIDGKSYYFSEEDGKVTNKTSQKDVADSVTEDISGDIQEAVEASVVAAFDDTQEEATTEEAIVEENIEVVETDLLATPTVEAEPQVVEPQAVEPQVVEESVVEQPVVEQEEAVVEQEPVVDEVQVQEEAVVEQEQAQPVVEQEQVQPVVQQEEAVVEQEQAPVEQAAQPVQSTNPYAQLNANISSSAKTLVGVTDGLWCTQVVQQSLALAGVSDAYQLWPDQYQPTYGYYTDTPEAGNLIYYYNGGRGVDHIAVYIGDGMAVHGNYEGKTVVASVNIDGGPPQYIQVQR